MAKTVKKRNPQDADVQRVKRSDDAIRQDIAALKADIDAAEVRLKDVELQLGRAISGELFTPPVPVVTADPRVAILEKKLDAFMKGGVEAVSALKALDGASH